MTNKSRIWPAFYMDRGGRRSNNNMAAVEATAAWDAELSQLCIGDAFARGAHSKLHRGTYRDQPVAVKVIEQPEGDDDLTMDVAAKMETEFTREVTLLSRLNHPNVIKLAGASKKSHSFFVITEYLSGGSLRELLRHREPLSVPTEVVIALDIAQGMEYIHSQGVIHRDLKPENVIFDQEFRIKVADFGVSCEQKRHGKLTELTGTYRWMAPEVIKHQHYGRKVDVYSFGIILWEMVTGAIPYQGMTDEQAAIAVGDMGLRPLIPPSCPAPLQALIRQCWTALPAERPEFKEIVKILKQFVNATARYDNLDRCPDLICQLGHKKNGLHHFIHKFRPFHA